MVILPFYSFFSLNTDQNIYAYAKGIKLYFFIVHFCCGSPHGEPTTL